MVFLTTESMVLWKSHNLKAGRKIKVVPVTSHTPMTLCKPRQTVLVVCFSPQSTYLCIISAWSQLLSGLPKTSGWVGSETSHGWVLLIVTCSLCLHDFRAFIIGAQVLSKGCWVRSPRDGHSRYQLVVSFQTARKDWAFRCFAGEWIMAMV